MAAVAQSTRDDRVLPLTRGLSLVLIPFLVVAFVVLYVFPGDTKSLFAWTIKPTMSAMVLGSAYLGGAYFFVRVLREPRWTAVGPGFLAVALFASLLGVATIVHWHKFNHGHVAFWIWAGLYFTAPFAVVAAWVVNQRFRAPERSDEVRLGDAARWVVCLVGLLALVQGIVMFLVPTRVIAIWPWTLTPLTCRVTGAIFCLGSAGVVALVDPRWTTIRLMLQVESIMLALILVAAVRAHAELDGSRPLTWLLLGGFAGVLLGSAYLWYAMEIRPEQRRA